MDLKNSKKYGRIYNGVVVGLSYRYGTGRTEVDWR